jgi:hypothetical protein
MTAASSCRPRLGGTMNRPWPSSRVFDPQRAVDPSPDSSPETIEHGGLFFVLSATMLDELAGSPPADLSPATPVTAATRG